MVVHAYAHLVSTSKFGDFPPKTKLQFVKMVLPSEVNCLPFHEQDVTVVLFYLMEELDPCCF